MLVGQTLVGCMVEDPPNLPLFETAALQLPSSNLVLNATLKTLHLPMSLQDLRESVRVEEDNLGFIIIRLRYSEVSRGRQIAQMLADQSIAAFSLIDQTSGAMKRLCNGVSLIPLPDTPLPAKLIEANISNVPLLTALGGFLLATGLILARENTSL